MSTNGFNVQAVIHIAKQRNGPAGENIDLVWLREFTRFENRAAPRHEDLDSFNRVEQADF
jgi:replicative DNA helicase